MQGEVSIKRGISRSKLHPIKPQAQEGGEMSHTKEPWEWVGDRLCGGHNLYDEVLYADDDKRGYGMHSAILVMDNGIADKEHIVACVNALAGIKNPAAVKELIEAAKRLASCPTVAGLGAHIRDEARRDRRKDELVGVLDALAALDQEPSK